MLLERTIRPAMKLFVLPFLYFMSMVPVLVGVWQALMFVEYNIGFRSFEPGVGLDDSTTLYFNGDVVAAAAIFVIGGPIFGSLSWVLIGIEGMSRLRFAAHLRRCAFLYAFVVILGALFVAEYVRNLVAGNPMYEVPLAVGIWLAAGFAIFVDALVLFWKRRRSDYVNLGGNQ